MLILQQDVNRSDFVETMRSLSYISLITVLTRVTDSSATLLDHVWTNQLHEANSGVVRMSTTDHFPIIVSTVLQSNYKNPNIKKIFRDDSDSAIGKLKSECEAFLRYLDQFANMSVDNRVNIFHERLYELYNKNCKLRMKQISLTSCIRPWITNDIKRLINRKHYYFRRYRQGLIDFDVYNDLKNVCSRSIRQSKVDYFKRIFDACSGDLKKIWHHLKHLMNFKVSCRSITLVKYKGNDLLHSNAISEAFNEHFANIATELDSSIPHIHNTAPIDYLPDPVVNSFYAYPSTSDEVKKIINAFPTKGGYAKWTPIYIYKCLCNVFSEHISNLFNSSIVEGCFPNCLKLARVIPVFKSGCRKNVSNYRPISTLPVLSKIFEKLMHKRLSQFLSSNKIIVSHQFGFRPSSSTGDAVLEFLDRVYELLNGGKLLMPVYLDFSKAFDTVNHNILLQKIERYGIRGLSNNWFRSYLLNRKQYVSIGDSNSKINTISMGVPQGSILGPALFLMYINDMSQCSELDFIHFADDTTVVASDDTESGLFVKVNRGLSHIDKWLSVNRLSLNIKKTKYMIITNKALLNRSKLKIRNKKIKKIDCIKFLGVMMDDKLNFDRHALHICGRVARAVGIINRISHHLAFSQIISLYYSIIYPHLIYCITVWGRVGSTGMARIQRMQRRAVKVIMRYDVSNRFTDHFMNVDSIYSYFTLIKLFKVLREGQHSYFYDRIIEVQVNHEHATRFKSNSCLVPPFFRKAKCQHAFVYQSIVIWNRLPTNIRSCISFSNFRSLLKKYIVSQQEPILLQ